MSTLKDFDEFREYCENQKELLDNTKKVVLRDWQVQAYNKFLNENKKGIIVAGTGTGKTHLGLKLINDIKNDEYIKDKKVLVVVPTIALQEQWCGFIKNVLGYNTKKIGGKENNNNDDDYDIDYYSKLVMENKETVFVDVAVVNSIRNKSLDYKNIILDEIHHYLSDIARTIFTLNSFNIILGLTSTIVREDNRTFDDFGLKVVYNYTQEEAIQDKILCEYEIKNVAVSLVEDEKVWYDKYDVDVKDYFPIFGYDLKSVFSPGYSREKMILRRAIVKRRMIVSNAVNKVFKAVEIIRENREEKIIVFCEYIKTASKVEELLRKNEIIGFGVYHSKMKDSIKTKILQDFQDNIIRVLISVKALDEGLNVPDCGVAIIIAGSKTARQMIQRTGRILRQKEGKKAVIYQVYAADTQDFKYLKNRTKFLRGFTKQEFY